MILTVISSVVHVAVCINQSPSFLSLVWCRKSKRRTNIWIFVFETLTRWWHCIKGWHLWYICLQGKYSVLVARKFFIIFCLLLWSMQFERVVHFWLNLVCHEISKNFLGRLSLSTILYDSYRWITQSVLRMFVVTCDCHAWLQNLRSSKVVEWCMLVLIEIRKRVLQYQHLCVLLNLLKIVSGSNAIFASLIFLLTSGIVNSTINNGA